ncbi:MAG: 30S ribosomal protein S16 [Actinobacteria bacterium]|nr:30S ribosomal protein S16 [Actinomycetota bacterium]
MAVKMRLRREGKRKQPFYRVVVADARSPRDGRFIEDIGYYQPLREPSAIEIKRERALYWLGEGVQPSDAVRQLLRVTGIWDEFHPGDVGRQRVTAAAPAVQENTTATQDAAADDAAVGESGTDEQPSSDDAAAAESAVDEQPGSDHADSASTDDDVEAVTS